MERLTKYSNDLIRNKAVNILRKLESKNGLNGDELALISSFCLIERVENNQLKKYEDLEEQGKLLKLPCAVGDTVYVLTECEHIPKRLDGTLYGTNGEIGTATGYYCPYEDNCPLEDEDFDDCEKYKEKTSVFEDTVGDITVGEDGVWIRTSNCSVCSQIGVYIFLTQEEAEVALKELSEK